MFCKKLSLARLLSMFLFRFFFVSIITICFYFTSPAILPLDFQTLPLVKSNIFSMKTLVFFFAGITDLMCFIWLLHMAGRQASFFLPRCFLFLSWFVKLPVSSVTEYTPFIKWCLRAIPIRRSRQHQVHRNAETFVSLMKDVKALMSSCSLQYVS